MKKTISKFLINIALKLDPDARGLVAPVVDGYNAGKIGNTVVITKKDRKTYSKQNNASMRATKSELIRQAKAQIALLVGRKACNMIEYDVKKGKDIIEVSGHLKVYVRNGSEKDEY